VLTSQWGGCHRIDWLFFGAWIVQWDVAAPTEIYEERSLRSKKPAPYVVCAGCNGPVQSEMSSKSFKEVTWHSECYDGDSGSGGDDPDEEEQDSSEGYYDRRGDDDNDAARS